MFDVLSGFKSEVSKQKFIKVNILTNKTLTKPDFYRFIEIRKKGFN